MAFGEKLGKIFSGIGAGLSFVPGPWSAIGIGLSAAGGVASSVAKAKKEREQSEGEPQQAGPAPVAPPDPSRPEQGQITQPPGYVSPQPATYQQGQQSQGQPDYRDQMRSEIANMIISDTRGLYG